MRRGCKFECFSFDVACVYTVWTPPFTSTGPICLHCIAHCVPRPVWIGPYTAMSIVVIVIIVFIIVVVVNKTPSPQNTLEPRDLEADTTFWLSLQNFTLTDINVQHDIFSEICLLTNAKRVASVRAETYCNLFSLSVEHFNAVLEHYPVMRRTMESVAAERLNKIGKNPSIVSNRAELEEDINTVNELIMQTTPLASSGSELSLAERAAEAEKQNEKEAAAAAAVAAAASAAAATDATTPTMKKSKSDCYVGGSKEDRVSLV